MHSPETTLLPIHFPLEGKRIFVTGGTGFVGSELVRQLVGQYNVEVCCLVRKNSNLSRWGGLPVETVIGDLLDPFSYEGALTSCHAVIHLAALSNWNDIQSPLMRSIVVDGTGKLLEISQINGERPFVYVSSVTAVNGTDHPEEMTEETIFALPEKGYAYAHAKHEAELLCQEFAERGNPVVIVNPSEVYGPDDDQLITAGTLLDFINGCFSLTCSGGTAVAHVEDVSAGIIAALQRGKGGERYILGGENLTISELARVTLSLAGKKERVIQLPHCIVKLAAIIEKYTKIPIGVNPAIVPYAVKYWFISAAKAEGQLGVQFRSARETLQPTVRWLLERI